jgi:hypothetical protein
MQLWAQATLSPGDRVQVREPEAREWIGEVVDVSPTEVVLAGFRGSRVSVPLRAGLLVERNSDGVGKYVLPLVAITGVAAVAGGVASVISATWTDPDKFEGTGSHAFLWGAAGGAILAIPFDLFVVLEGWVNWEAVPSPGSDGETMALSPGDYVRVREPEAGVWIGELVEMSGTELLLLEDGSASPVSVPLRADLLVARSEGPVRNVLTPILISALGGGVLGGVVSIVSRAAGPDRFQGTRSDAFLWGAAGGAIAGAGGAIVEITVRLLSGGWGERWVAVPPPGAITLGPVGSGAVELSVTLPFGGQSDPR